MSTSEEEFEKAKKFDSRVSQEDLKLQYLPEAGVIKDGFSVSGTRSFRLHVKLQETLSLPELGISVVVRFRVAIPKKKASDSKTWSVSKIIYRKDGREGT